MKISSKEVELFQQISEGYKLGTPFKCLATVSAYKIMHTTICNRSLSSTRNYKTEVIV